jgi:hypothetical protein
MIANALHVLAASEPEPVVDNVRPEAVLKYLRSRIGGRLEDETLYVSDFISVYADRSGLVGTGCDVYVRVFGYAVWGMMGWNESKLPQLISVVRTVNRIVHDAALKPDQTLEYFQAWIGMELRERVQDHAENQLYHIRGFTQTPYHKFWTSVNYQRWMKKVLEKLQHHQAQAATEPGPISTWSDVLALLHDRPNKQYPVRLRGIDVTVRCIGSSPVVYVEAKQNSLKSVTQYVRLMPINGRLEIDASASTVNAHTKAVPLHEAFYQINVYELFRKFHTAKAALTHLLQQIPEPVLQWLHEDDTVEAAAEPAPASTPQKLLAQLYLIASKHPITVTVEGVPVHFDTKSLRQSPRISYGDNDDYRIIGTDGSTKYNIILPKHNIPVPYIAGEQPLQLMHRLAMHMVRWHRK